MLKLLHSFTFATYKLKPNYLIKLSSILKLPVYKMNEEIRHYGNVRLLDEHNKLIGVFSYEEACNKAKKTDKDIIMLNDQVKPALCKLCNYSDELALKFIGDILKLKPKQLAEQNLKLGHNITPQDLKIKVNHAQELLKKQNRLRVYIICPIEFALHSKNVLYTFRDMCTQMMVPVGDIKVKDYVPKEEQFVGKDEEKSEQVELNYDFESLEKKVLKHDFPQVKLERMINQLYARQITQKKLDIEEAVQELKSEAPEMYLKEGEFPEELITNQPLFKRPRKQATKTELTEDDDDDDELDIEAEWNQAKKSDAFIQADSHDKLVRFLRLVKKAEKLR